MTEEQQRRYQAALHAVQTGVMHELHIDPKSGEPKHLRTGINSAMCEHAALVRLLITAGVLTEHDYYEALITEAEAEKARYEARLSEAFGATVRLG